MNGTSAVQQERMDDCTHYFKSEELSGIQHVFFNRINKERNIVLPTSPTMKRLVSDIPISVGCTMQKGS
jgi:hypothetical protein